MLKYRLISAFTLMLIVIIALFLLPPSCFAIITIIVCMLAAWEWGKISGFVLYYERVWLVISYVLLLIIMLFFLLEYHCNIHQPIISGSLWISLIWWTISLILVLYYPDSATIWRNFKILRLIFGLLIIVPFFWSMIVLRVWRYDENHYNGALWLLYIMILVWGTDSGAYVFGKLLGKHKLAPKVSPEKTWQGCIGGLFTAAIIAYSYDILINLKVSSLTLLICSVTASLASILGDLTESMFKREAGIKDSGHLIPGHGGILDRIDSLTAAVPIFVCLLLLVFRII